MASYYVYVLISMYKTISDWKMSATKCGLIGRANLFSLYQTSKTMDKDLANLCPSHGSITFRSKLPISNTKWSIKYIIHKLLDKRERKQRSKADTCLDNEIAWHPQAQQKIKASLPSVVQATQSFEYINHLPLVKDPTTITKNKINE